MMTDYIYSWGYRIDVKNGKTIFKDRNNRRIIGEDLIGIRGEGSISTIALKQLIKNGIEISILSNKGFSKIYCGNSKFKKLNLKLLEAYLNPKIRMKFISEILNAATIHKIWILKTYNINSNLIDKFKSEAKILLSKLKNSIEYLSIEAQIARKYYELLKNIIPIEIGFKGRIKRPPRDLFNSLISYGNTYLYNLISFMLKIHGFDVRIGLIHKPFRKRISLAIDMAENFRQIIVDSAALSIVTTKSFKPKIHYLIDRNTVYLTKRGRRNFLKLIRFKIYESKVHGETIYDHIHNQIHSLENFLIKNRDFKAFKILPNLLQ